MLAGSSGAVMTWQYSQPGLVTYLADRDEWVYLELITKLHNPRFDGDEKDSRSYFGITDAVLHDSGGPPKDDLSPLLRR